MGELKNAKMFGGIGSILMLVGVFVPVIGALLPIIGLILVIIAIKQIADETKDHEIFKNYLIYFILNIVAVAASLVIMIFALGASLSGFSYSDLMSYQGGTVTDPSQIFSDFGTLIGGCLLALAVFWILMIIGTIFLRKSFNSIAKYTNVGLFATTGLVYLIGAATLIIVIGAIIIFIAEIMQIVAFFSLPEKIEGATVATTA